MSSESDSKLNAGVDGDPVYCSECEAPIVLYSVPQKGYVLVCGCENISADINPVAAESNLFSPITGKWSEFDDIDVMTDYDD